MAITLKDLGPLPKIHPRMDIVHEARRELDLALDEIVKKHKLTTGERLQVVNGVCSSFVAAVARSAIRHERHPDNPEKPGDEE